MRKMETYTTQREQEYRRYCDDMLNQDSSTPDRGFGGLIAKLEKALSNVVDDTVIKKVSNACAKRKQAAEKRKAFAKKRDDDAEAASCSPVNDNESESTV
jgi:hypothetical protein